MPGVDAIVGAIEREFDVVAPHPSRITDYCKQLAACLGTDPSPEQLRSLTPLFKLCSASLSDAAVVLTDVLTPHVRLLSDPLEPLLGLLEARHPDIVARALQCTGNLIDAGRVTPDGVVLAKLAQRVDRWDQERLETWGQTLAALLEAHCRHQSEDFERCLRGWFVTGLDPCVRRLAARLLDLRGTALGDDTARELLGDDALAFWKPYLDFTRATHCDLLVLHRPAEQLSRLTVAFRDAEASCGQPILREVIADLGWPRVSLGLSVEEFIGIRVGRSLPFLMTTAEAVIFDECGDAVRSEPRYVVIAHGDTANAGSGGSVQMDRIRTFRDSNLAHAAVLIDILDDAPLTADATRRILDQMDRIVEDFITVFADLWPDAAILPAVYAELRDQVVSAIDAEPDAPFVSADVSRLVRTFEDPKTLGDVRTIHGLKRFLHQKGLALGRSLASGSATNRTVDLVLVEGRDRTVVRSITYADFEAGAPEERAWPVIPAPVRIVVDAYGRQLLYGCRLFPRTDVYCYGNETHYYLTFRNHPAFLRIDFSPPLYGGMIDLEYYGVSKYDLEHHPNVSLACLRQFLEAIDFEVSIDNTRVHARYDKERALRLSQVRSVASALFCLAPYLMDLDWIIGSLAYDDEDRRRVADAWIERFLHWRTLPMSWMLTDDRLHIVAGASPGPSGTRPLLWPGGTAYQDRFTAVAGDTIADTISTQLARLGLGEAGSIRTDEWHAVFGQVDLETLALNPIRRAVERGQLMRSEAGLSISPETVYRPRHEAAYFAALLNDSHERIAASMSVAAIVAQLEHMLPFTTSGHVNGHEVQSAPLPLIDRDLIIVILRDQSGSIRLAAYAAHDRLFQSRIDTDEPWRDSASTDAPQLLRWLRSSNYPLSVDSPAGPRSDGDIRLLVAHFQSDLSAQMDQGSLQRRIITGVGAAPGRAFGRALFPLDDRSAADFADAILVAPMIRPEDSCCFQHVRGVVSTGGGILSHAGLLAAQYRKPAMIIPGRWEKDDTGKTTLAYTCLEYSERRSTDNGFVVGIRENIQAREHRLRDGDLIAMDTSHRTVTVLGQDPLTVALYDALQRLGDITAALRQSSDPHHVLTLRGHRLQVRHQLERIVRRLADPVVAEHAILEILFADTLSPGTAGGSERTDIILLFQQNAGVRDHIARILQTALQDTQARFKDAIDTAHTSIPCNNSLHSVMSQRLRAVELAGTLRDLATLLRSCGIRLQEVTADGLNDVERLTTEALHRIRDNTIDACMTGGDDPRPSRHPLRQLATLDSLLGERSEDIPAIAGLNSTLDAADAQSIRSLEDNWILWPEVCGYETAPLIGWKGAHLAEVARLDGHQRVPSWFAVTEGARQLMLSQPVTVQLDDESSSRDSTVTLGEAIHVFETHSALTARLIAHRIALLWDAVVIPPKLQEALIGAYRRLTEECSPHEADGASHQDYVAIRSSTCEEDAENASRAGEFDTFLFVHGDELFLRRLRQAWAGFWTERALLSRSVLGVAPEEVRGGLVVQTMVRARVSGVLQTVNVAQGNLHEIIVNATLGLGEGVVSGVAAADHVVIEKNTVGGNAPLSFRYITLDKSEQVVFDQFAGSGTYRVPSLFHRRLRPALEYTELRELVEVAVRLESAYGYPIDMEFALDDRQLWILQVRPVASFVAALQESLAEYPFHCVRQKAMQTAEGS